MTQTLSREVEGTQIPDAPSRSSFALALSDCRVLIGRNVKHIARNAETNSSTSPRANFGCSNFSCAPPVAFAAA